MRRFLGVLVLPFGCLLWLVEIGISLYGAYFIVKTFIDDGILVGILTIPLVFIALWIVYFIIGAMGMGFSTIFGALLGGEETEEENQNEPRTKK